MPGYAYSDEITCHKSLDRRLMSAVLGIKYLRIIIAVGIKLIIGLGQDRPETAKSIKHVLQTIRTKQGGRFELVCTFDIL